MRVQDIPTEQFHSIRQSLQSKGWQLISAFEGVARSVDYQEIYLMKDENKVKFVWDNWSEGEISADREIEEVGALL